MPLVQYLLQLPCVQVELQPVDGEDPDQLHDAGMVAEPHRGGADRLVREDKETVKSGKRKDFENAGYEESERNIRQKMSKQS